MFLFVISVLIILITLWAFRACLVRAKLIVDSFSQCWQLYGFSSVWVHMWCWRITLRVIYLSHCSQLKALCEPLCVCLRCAFVAWVFSHSVHLLMNGSLYSNDCPLNVLIKCALPGTISKRPVITTIALKPLTFMYPEKMPLT